MRAVAAKMTENVRVRAARFVKSVREDRQPVAVQPSPPRAAGAAAPSWPASRCSPCCINFGFLVFGVTDYASKLTTAHYGAITAREPREEGTQAACRLLGKRLAEWVAVFCDGRKDQHPLNKSDARLSPG